MKKIMWFCIPFMTACLMLGMMFYLTEASNRATASSSLSTFEGKMIYWRWSRFGSQEAISQDRS